VSIGGTDAQSPDPHRDLGPFLLEKLAARTVAQPGGGAGQHEHADPAANRHQPVFLEALISLGDGERIGALIGGEGAHRGERIPLGDRAVEDHRDDLVAQAKINGAIGTRHA
jgi:hypothetical protein